MKVYTKTGDGGTTSLVGGKRVSKFDQRLEAYGTVDELNSFVGDLITVMKSDEDRALLCFIQNKLFVMGSNLACEGDCGVKLQKLDKSDYERLEKRIDAMDKLLPRLSRFVLPGGVKAAAKAHICRTVSRRAEREICRLAESCDVDENIKIFTNRLSDYFFVLSRYCNFIENSEEIFWDNNGE